MKHFKPRYFPAILFLFIAFQCQAQITFTSPTMSSQWPQGSMQEIMWNADMGAPTDIRLFLILDEGVTHMQLLGDVPTSDGSFIYKVPSDAQISGQYYVMATTTDFDETNLGTSETFGIVSGTTTISEPERNSIELSIFPNPARTSANISFNLEKSSPVDLSITDLSGKEVIPSSSCFLNSGQHNMNVDLTNLSPGLYFYCVTFGEAVSVQKLHVTE